MWRGLASELRERESCKVISVRSLGGRHGFSELCPLVLNFANAPQTSDQRWFELAERRTGASQGQESNVLCSKTAQNRFQNGAKSATTQSAKLRWLAPTREVPNHNCQRLGFALLVVIDLAGKSWVLGPLPITVATWRIFGFCGKADLMTG